ncbi:TIGR04086 family membrane protein [Pseudoflavonifractor phocaeensis]|uniref:TIGR04086 family membrane protein n=1 Tax=Pseudoflavonifractor phocaeensis TaxID=1870988 RepID=UPI001958A1E1|nr:TIGR04086 family membrane protein [Pseudoflavonifractor phocaeensis]MBM6871018.1 TIGR04086 family membrane protein [Pseudoflavonifractor phocaeensis]MBM6936942.1 TIGR04086 family membrane protein [Pseudoflavonifractor phocaeensis]
MGKEEHQGTRVLRYGGGVLLGGGVAFAAALAVLLACAWAVSMGYAPESAGYQLAVGACVTGGLAGGITAAVRCARRSLPVGLAAGGVLFLLILTVGALWFQALPLEKGGLGLLLGALCGGGCGGLVSRAALGRKKRRK